LSPTLTGHPQRRGIADPRVLPTRPRCGHYLFAIPKLGRQANLRAVGKRRFVIICCRHVERRRLGVREGIEAGLNPDWESLTCASATILKLVAL
jgi:hypothetical protein